MWLCGCVAVWRLHDSDADVLRRVAGEAVASGVGHAPHLDAERVARVYKVTPEELALYDLDSCVRSRIALRDV